MNLPNRMSDSPPFVIDASVASAWMLDDESAPFADEIHEIVRINGGLVPQHWHFEIRNALLMSVRRGRITTDSVGMRLRRLRQLTIRTDMDPNLDAAFYLAQTHHLTFYDALYLELALRRGTQLATLDNALERAATAEGVAML